MRLDLLDGHWFGEYRNDQGDWVLVCSLAPREEVVLYLEQYVRQHPRLKVTALNVRQALVP